jgi:hypothetical protein
MVLLLLSLISNPCQALRYFVLFVRTLNLFYVVWDVSDERFFDKPVSLLLSGIRKSTMLIYRDTSGPSPAESVGLLSARGAYRRLDHM